MIGRPLVSICIPSYQGARWIQQAVASALAQEYPNFEVVVSDDASTDGTAETVEAISDERVRLARSEIRLGMAANWNRSIRLAEGSYIKFLMQDDVLDPRCIARMAEVMNRNPSIGFVFSPRIVNVEGPSDSRVLRTARRLEGGLGRLGPLVEHNDGRDLFEIIRRTGLRENWIGEPTAVMARRDALARVGLFSDRLKQLTDLDLWLRLAFFFDVGFVPETLATFTMHSRSASNSNLETGEAWLDAGWILEGLRCDPEARRALGLRDDATVWLGIVKAEVVRRLKRRGRSGQAYWPQLKEYIRYRMAPTRDLNPPLRALVTATNGVAHARAHRR